MIVVIVMALLVWLETETYGHMDYEATVLYQGRLVDEQSGEPIAGAKVFGMGLEHVARDPESGRYWEKVFDSFGPTGHIVGLGVSDNDGRFQFERQVGFSSTGGIVSALLTPARLTVGRARCFLRIEIPGRDPNVVWPDVVRWDTSEDPIQPRVDATLHYGTIRIKLP